MSSYQPLPGFRHSEGGSDCTLNKATEQDDKELEEDLTGGLPPITEAPRVPTTTGPVSTDGWKATESYHSGQSNDEIEHSALHCTACKDEYSEYYGTHNTYRERIVSMPSSPPIVYPELPKSTLASPPVSRSPLSTRSCPDLSVLKGRLENAVLCNQTMHQECSELNCPAHRHHRKRPLYSSAVTHSNATISAIEPPRLPHHERGLYEAYDDATDEEGDEVPRLERVQDERDVAQATTEMEGMWQELIIKGYWQDPVWKLANDSTATARGGKAQHYSIGNGLLDATTTGGEKCLYIPKGHATNGEALRALAIHEIHYKGHHSAQRDQGYTTEYLFWPKMRKGFGDFVAHCEQCQISKERSTIPSGDAQMLPLPSEIFTSYSIDFMRPFTTAKTYDRVLVVVDRAVGYGWLIPTTTKATAITTIERLQNYLFTPHGVPTSIVSDADPRFTSQIWRQTLKTMGIEHIMASPGHHQTNSQAEPKIRELKTALWTVITRRQTNWLISLPQLASYSNAGYSETIDMSP